MRGPGPAPLARLVRHRHAVALLWCAIVVFVVVKHNLRRFPNNYEIYRHAYVHAVEGRGLYARYPQEYDDRFCYGPLFSLIVAPFAVLPELLGHMLWVAALAGLLFRAVRALPLECSQQNAILLIASNELLTAALHVQFSVAVAALVVLGFARIQRGRDFRAPLPMLVAAFVKLYGIVGLPFFVFAREKRRFVLGCLVWSAVLFVAPMVLSSPRYVLHAYAEWYDGLVLKNAQNASLTSFQDISIPGFFRRCVGDASLPGLPFLVAGTVLFGLPFLRTSRYGDPAFRLLMLASALMFPVLFSSASEHSTYILAFLGIGIWFVLQPRPRGWMPWTLLALAFVFGSLNSTDLYPRALRDFLRLHSVKALPCTLIWLRILYEMLAGDLGRYRAQLDEFEQV